MNLTILGYKDGQPIYPVQRGMIATCALVTCSQCRTVIRSAGGPMWGAICIKCHEGEHNDPSKTN